MAESAITVECGVCEIESPQRDPQTYAIIGAAMEVHRILGCGFAEPVYQKAMEAELELRGVPFVPQLEHAVVYKGRTLDATYRPDFICFGSIIVELKALCELSSIERAQVLNYLKVTGLRRALLLNFGRQSLEFERFVK